MKARAWVARWLFGAAAFLAAAGSLWADDPLRDVKHLYDTAAYEETLVALSRLDDPALIDQVDEYRALCLIALHRDAEAERAMEGLVLRHPLPLDGLADRSPKFAALYQAVRRRLLPTLANGSYKKAKASFEAANYSTAVRQFGEALELLRSAEGPPALRDLELVAEEFRALAEQRMRPVGSSSLPEASVAIALAPTPPLAAEAFAPAPRVYDTADLDVTPPVALNQALPPWNPPWPHVARRTYTGQLQIIVNERGIVSSADIVQPSFGAYDGLLLNTVKQWRYNPALYRDHPVQYRRIIDFVLKGSDPSTLQR